MRGALLSRVGGLALILFVLTLVPPGGRALAEEEISNDPFRRLVMWHDKHEKVSWYEPELDYILSYDFKIYPAIGKDETGKKWLVLRAIRKSERGVGVKSLEVGLDGVMNSLPLKHHDVAFDRNGCRVAEKVSLDGQEALIRSIASAKEVELTVNGEISTDRYRLTSEDLTDFQQVLEAYDAPETAKAGPEPEAHATNPEIIPSTRVQPVFPKQARKKIVRGKVTLQAVVRKDGTVGTAQVIHSTAWDCGFEAAAMSAVMQWRYKPGTKDGEPVDTYFTVDIDFNYR